jgi:polygalacturonase
MIKGRRYFLRASMAMAFASVPSISALAPMAAFAREIDPWDHATWIVKSIKRTSFPKRDFAITDFGARSGGQDKNTKAFAAAIDAANAAGGGRVVVPAGTWLTGAIHLKSNVNLHVAEGATVLFSTDPADYPIVFTRWEGIELMNYSPLIYAKGQENIAITGNGTLDGQSSAEHWWSWKGPWSGGTVTHGWMQGMVDQRPARAKLFKMAEEFVPVQQRVFGEGSYLRPAFIQPYDCDRVLIEGVKVRGAPFWQIHPVLTRNIIVRGLDIMGHGPNNDGCDPESVDMMLIEDCTFDTGDDCIAVNSGRNADGRRLNTPSQNIVIRNCRMREGHGGITVGSQISGGARNIFAERCNLDSPNLNCAIRFKNNALRGGFLEDFYFRDITVGQVKSAAIVCDFNYEEGAKGNYRPHLSNVFIERMTVAQAKRVIDSQGLPGAPVGTITLRNCRFNGVTDASVVTHTQSVVLENVRVNGTRVDLLQTMQPVRKS